MRIAGLRLLASLRMLAIAGLAAGANAQAATWVVQTTGEAAIGSTNCSAVAGTCATLRDAIAKAASGDTIVFAAAIDGQTIGLDRYHDDVVGRAAFPVGNRTLTIDAAAGLAHGVVIERKHLAGTDPVTPFRLFNVASGGHLTLRGLRLRNGDALGGGSSFGGGALGAGGAIFNQGFVSIERCTFDGNLARGGNAGSPYEGFYGGGGMGEFSRSARGGGRDAGEGGRTGIYFVLDDGHGTPPHPVVEDGGNGGNGGFAGGGGKGGEAGDTQHKAGDGGDGGFGGGGGMAGGGANNGSAAGAHGGKGGFGGGAGGGIYNTPGVSGGFGGGAAYGGVGSGDGGGGAGMGGAIFNDGGRVIVVNSTFTDNHARGGSADAAQGQGAGFGGAIFNYDGRLDVAFTTLAGNGVAGGAPETGSAAHPGAADGGAIYSLGDATAWSGNAGLFLSANADLTFSHAIAAGSIGASHDIVVGTIAGGSASSSGDGNLVMSHSGLAASVVSAAGPQLGALVAGGGLASVMSPQAGSPAIDAAGTCGGSVFIDQRGVTRPQGAACDIGAVEVALPPTQFNGAVTVTTLADSVANDGVCSLREAVSVVNGTGNAAALGCSVSASDYNAILFAPALAGGSIDSANGPIEILGTTQVAINACAVPQPGIESCEAPRIRFGNAPAWRLFTIDSGAQMAILHLTLAGGGVIDTSNTDGAAIANAGTLVLQNVAIEHVIGAQHGGAIANTGWLGAFNSRFAGNQAYIGGGAISSSGTLLLYRAELSDNQGGSGAAIDVRSGGATIIASNITANYSQSSGGGIHVAGGATLDLSASTLSANRAIAGGGGTGGGIASAGTLTVVDSTLQGNSIDLFGPAGGRKGGAIFVAGGTATIQSSTIAGNTTQGGSGDGIHRDAGSVSVNGSIVADNGTGNCAGGIGDGGGNLSHGDASCAGFAQGDPMLGALADNGGPTRTMLPATGSAAVDRIACAQALDQRGIVRPQGPACDIGAVEVAVPRALSVGVIGQGTVSAAALPAPIVGAIAACDSSGTTCTAGYAQGAVVVLVASAAPGWTLAGWSGEGCSDNRDGSASVAVVADYVCTATFAQDATASTISATLTPTASVYGQPVTLDVSVLPQAGRPVPTGNLTLVIDDASYSMLLDADGHWSQAVAYATPGTHAIRLAYDGDASNLAAAPVDLSLSTTNAGTHLIASAPASIALGEALNVGVQALADAPSSYAPTGTVVVSDGDGDTCTIDLASATACTLHPASTGKKTISAHYAGDLGFDGSDAAALALQVTPTRSFTVSGIAGPHGSITPATQAVNSGGAATFTLTPDVGYTATLSSTCPAGTLTDDRYTTGLITADCAVLAVFAGVDDPLALLVSDGRAYARYGQTLRYLVMVSNNTGSDIGALRLDASASPDLDTPAGSWCSVGGSAEAPSCTPTGSGPFSVPAFGVPAHGTMLWLMSVPVLNDAPDASVDYRVTLTGPALPTAIARTDSDTLVLFRDGFDHDGGDGTGEAPRP